jgi:succinate-acetate transporter protein
MYGQGVFVFDVNDFDEAYLGHYTWDLQRLAASVAPLGWTKTPPDPDIERLLATYLRSCLDQVHGFVVDERDHEWSLRLGTATGHRPGAQRTPDHRRQHRAPPEREEDDMARSTQRLETRGPVDADPHPEDAPGGGREQARADEPPGWDDRSRIVLTPVPPPSILGLYGFAGATFIVASHLAGIWGDQDSPRFLFPFAAFFGGLAQFLAGMWSYRARDGLATAMHGMWGSFWMAYGLLHLLFAVGALTEPTGAFPELGFWFIALAAITWAGTAAAAAENLVLTAVLGVLAAGATVASVAEVSGSTGWTRAAGWLFVVAAVLAFYLATAMMLEGTWKRVVLPLGKLSRAANTPGESPMHPVQYSKGMPGAKVGQ